MESYHARIALYSSSGSDIIVPLFMPSKHRLLLRKTLHLLSQGLLATHLMGCWLVWSNDDESTVESICSTTLNPNSPPLRIMTEAYCVKEKAKREISSPQEIHLKNGRRALQGVCASCGTKLFR